MDPEQIQGTGRNALDLLLEQLAQGWAQGLSFLGELLRPWNAYQVLIVGASSSQLGR
jgi:hypothetical protein